MLKFGALLAGLAWPAVCFFASACLRFSVVGRWCCRCRGLIGSNEEML